MPIPWAKMPRWVGAPLPAASSKMSETRGRAGQGDALTIAFRILGPVEAWCGDRRLALGGAKARTLLTVLLLRANEVVPTERLIDELWDGRPPASARNLVHGYVSELRRRLGADVLRTEPSGYLLRTDRGRLDLHRFEDLLGEAERAADEGRTERVSERLRAALALWRGPALGGIGSDSLRLRMGARLEEQRLAALERRIDADFDLGQHESLIGELAELVADHPFRERLRGQLMTALWRAGRPAEALQAYQAGAEVLRRELGIEPGPELQQLERSIRAADPLLLAEPAVLPSQLPPDIGDFTGSAAAVARAHRVLSGDPGVMATLVVSGQPGVGKTTLAVHVAHRLRQRFPDGQLFVDLRGPEPHPLDPGDVLAGFLRALGVHGVAIPHDPEERAALYRARLADRRILVLLDNAAGEAQVRPLLPAGPGCATIITTRLPLAGLAGVQTLPLTVLEAGEAVELLARVAGPARVAAEPEPARAIAELCGFLPLAVRIAGARLAAKPHWRPSRLARRLEDERGRLDELRAGDLEVRASLALSYRGLAEDTARAFRLLGLPTRPDFPVWMVAALIDAPVARAEALVERLVDAHLLEAAGEDRAGQLRYRFHGLVRAFARERLRLTETAGDQREALARALGGQLALAERARAVLSPGDAREAPPPAARRWLPDDAATVAAVERNALDWFEAERANLVEAVRQASEADLTSLAWELACCLPAFLALRGYWQDWRESRELALAAARRAGDRTAEAHMLWSLGEAHLGLRDRWGAQAYFEQCLARYRELGDAYGERHTLLALGFVTMFAGDADGAARQLEHCRALCRAAGERHGEAVALRGLATLCRQRGESEEAIARLTCSLEVHRADGDRYWEASVLRLLGDLHRAEGRHAEAAVCLEHALEIFRAFRERFLEARVLYSTAELHLARGSPEQAARCLERCGAIYRELNLRGWEIRATERLDDARSAAP